MNQNKFNPENWDWYAFLDANEKVKNDFHEQATVKSGNWVTCACGQLCKDLPRESDKDNEPKDMDLTTLGVYFHGNILNKDWLNAKITLNDIEKRTQFLLNTQK